VGSTPPFIEYTGALHTEELFSAHETSTPWESAEEAAEQRREGAPAPQAREVSFKFTPESLVKGVPSSSHSEEFESVVTPTDIAECVV